MKLDNIYRTLVAISPDLDSKEAYQIWRYIHSLLEDEEAVAKESLTTEREWVGLTDEEVDELVRANRNLLLKVHEVIRRVEYKLKEKNT